MLRPLATWANADANQKQNQEQGVGAAGMDGGVRANAARRSRHVYGGALRWATMPLSLGGAPSSPGSSAQGSSWHCLRDTTPAALLRSRLAGDTAGGAAAGAADAAGGGASAPRAPAAGGRAALELRARAARSCANAGTKGGEASPSSTFLAAGPELTLLGASLLTPLRAELAFNPLCQRLQPLVPEAASPCARGCIPMCQRLQPHVPEAATVVLEAAAPCARGCNPTCPGAELAALLQPPRASQLHAEPQPSRWKRSEEFHMAPDWVGNTGVATAHT